MKIGIVTITNGGLNFGNRLQNYALQKQLEIIGLEVETIDNKEYGECANFKQVVKKNISIFAPFIYKMIEKENFEQAKYFHQFNKEYIKFTNEKYTLKNIEKTKEKNFDFFITGSDQVWNPNFQFNTSIEFLTFAEPSQRLSYAASFGVDSLDDLQKKTYKEYLDDMATLSVREDAGSDLISSLIGKNAEVHVDPTMLLSGEQWRKIAKKPKIELPEKYLLKYFLGKDIKTNNLIEKIAKENNYKIIDVSDEKNKIGPSEFLSLIDNASMICTDSFHGSVFSILFRKNFFVFSRDDKVKSMESRITTLLKKFDLNNRKIVNTQNEVVYTEIDYDLVDLKLIKEREKSVDYLKKSISK